MASSGQTASITLPADHPTAVVFLDETGVIEHPHDPYFGIGCLKVSDHGEFARQLRVLRDRFNYKDELHWANFDKGHMRGRDDIVQMAREAINLVFDSEAISFKCVISNREHGDLTVRFKHHKYPAHKAYEDFAAQVLDSIVDETEIVSVLADQQSTPPAIRFEAAVKASVNSTKTRLAVANVCRLDSRCHDGLQLIDVLLGAATLDLRQGRLVDSEKQKQQLLAHLLDRCDCGSFRPQGKATPRASTRCRS